MKSNKLPSIRSSLFPKTVDDLFNQFWGPEPRAAFDPAVDVEETPDAYLVRAELPGVDPEEVEVTVGQDSLTLKGEKKVETKTEGARGHITERVHGAFERTFKFPVAIATDDVDAEYMKGVLHITLRKAEAAKTRKIEVRGA